MTEHCIFCEIAAGRIPAQVLYENEWCMAFHDITPVAPVHFLVIPKPHIKNIAALADDTVLDVGMDGGATALVGHIFGVIAKLAATLPLEGGYRIVTNTERDAVQSVFHLHFHVIGGKELSAGMA